ncbi:uncharacterized protein F5147DRAFT_766904 [Suillus discolor]|uniref:Uncharacterized protein n=1 Tax=Suillus discolor TaxID=1912936 RepID=A0A9P7K1F4_9AGAM|nr:uncharacterized protein F5147DRAFT_766904 [Suillus discolor]KAG2121039.1 hypothetical protein F5147DRAFT_766904 [Suillus discolor]
MAPKKSSAKTKAKSTSNTSKSTSGPATRGTTTARKTAAAPRSAPSSAAAKPTSHTTRAKATTSTFSAAEAKKLEALKKVEKKAALKKAETQKKWWFITETRKRTAAMLAKESADFEEEDNHEDGEEGEDESVISATRWPRKSRKVTFDSSDDEAEAPAEDPLEEDEANPSCAKDILCLEDSSDEEPTPEESPANVSVEDASSTHMLQDYEIVIKSIHANISNTTASKGATKVTLNDFNSPRAAKMEEVQADDDLKGKLVAYWPSKNYIGNNLKEAVDWLLLDEVFLYDGIDLEARTYDKSRIWMNNAFAYLIEDTFWSVKGDTVKMGKKGNTYCYS